MYHFPLKLVSRNKQTIAVVEETALPALPFSLEHNDISEIRNCSELVNIPPLTIHQWKIISLLTVSLEFNVDSLNDSMHNVQERTNWLLITCCSPNSSSEECVMIPFTLSAMGLRKLEEDAHVQLGTKVEGEYQIYILSEPTQTSSSPVIPQTSLQSYRTYSMLPFLQACHRTDKKSVSLNDCDSNYLESEEIGTSTTSVISEVRNVEHDVTNDINDTTKCNNSDHEHDSVKVSCERIAFCDTVEEMINVIMSTIRLSICKISEAETHIFWPQMLTFPVNINCDIVKDRIAKHAALLLPKRPFLQHIQQFKYNSPYSFRAKLRQYQANASTLKVLKNLADMLEERIMPVVKHENSGAWERHVMCEPHLLLKQSLSDATDATVSTTNTIKRKFVKKSSKKEVNDDMNYKGGNSYHSQNNDTCDKSVVLVKGKYNYYHYKIDGYNDDGWGCAYRSLQTILSWFQYAGYISEPIPTILTIQKILSVVDSDKTQKKSFVGSHEWIGSYEIMLVLQHFMPTLECTIQHIDSGAALDTDTSLIQLLEAHFALPEACPVMIGGSSYAHTIAGMCIDKDSLRVQYLILDPHYSSNITNSKTIINKGYVGWKSAKKFFESNSWYNICIPHVDSYEPR